MSLMINCSQFLPAIALACLLSQGCSSKADHPAPASPPPAKVENRVKESDLTLVTLTPEAEKRLGIELAEAVEKQVSGVSEISGEVMLIPGNALSATAPMAGNVHLVRRDLRVGQTVRKGEPMVRLTPVISPQRDLRVTYEADVQSAKVRLDAATQQLERARRLLRDLAGSQKNVEIAEQEFGQAKAAYDVALQRLERLKSHPLESDIEMTIDAPASGVVRQLQASENQTVSAGAVLLEVADFSRVWVRVPVYAGDVDSVSRAPSVRVRDVNGKGLAREAFRVPAPPTADPLAVTADLYFELANPDGQLRPGQRMTVLLPSRTSPRKGIAVPVSAVLYDMQGGAWVYVAGGPHEYRRQRVEVIQNEGGLAIISRGLTPGVKVVTAGAAELFGTEFGAGK